MDQTKEWQEELTKLNDSMHELRSKRRKLRNKTNDQFSPYSIGIMWIIFALSDWSVTVPLQYMQQKSRCVELTAIEDMKQRLLHWHQGADETAKAAMKAPGHSKTKMNQYKAAQKYIQEYQLYSWIGNENMNKGIAPTSRDVLDIRRCIRDSEELALSTASLPPPLRREEKKWITRFRKRWDMRVSSFTLRTVLSPQAMQAKVPFVLFTASIQLASLYVNVPPPAALPRPSQNDYRLAGV